MTKVRGLNIKVNFNYCIKAVVPFMSWIVVNKLNEFHKILFRKLDKNFNCFI